MAPLNADALAIQRRFELTRAYDAVQLAAERLELAGLDDAAECLRNVRRDVYDLLVTAAPIHSPSSLPARRPSVTLAPPSAAPEARIEAMDSGSPTRVAEERTRRQPLSDEPIPVFG